MIRCIPRYTNIHQKLNNNFVKDWNNYNSESPVYKDMTWFWGTSLYLTMLHQCLFLYSDKWAHWSICLLENCNKFAAIQIRSQLFFKKFARLVYCFLRSFVPRRWNSFASIKSITFVYYLHIYVSFLLNGFLMCWPFAPFLHRRIKAY